MEDQKARSKARFEEQKAVPNLQVSGEQEVQPVQKVPAEVRDPKHTAEENAERDGKAVFRGMYWC